MGRVTLFCFLWVALIGMNGHAKEEKEMTQCPALTGRVVMPTDGDYQKSRLVSNYYTSKDSFPTVIVYCQKAEDVQNAVKWALCKQISIRVRSGGHNHEGFSTGSGAIVIDVSEMKKVHVDKKKMIATVEPGITGGQLYRLLSQEGFTQVGGTCEEVGISGLMLTGGMGPLWRREGLSCDSLLSLEMVNAKGEVLKVNPDNEHKDLFWACCGGGGGNFGVVTSLTIKIFPSQPVTWFNIGWGWDQPVEKIITTWQQFFLNEDKKWFSHLDLWAKPFPVDQLKKQPIKVMGVYYGSPEDAKKELAPFLTLGQPKEQTIERVEWVQAIKQFEEATSTFITAKPEYKSTGAYAMQPLPKEAIQIIVQTLQNSPSPLLNVLFFTLGGAAQNKSPIDSAFFYRKAKFFITYSIQWLQANQDARHLKEVDALRERLLPYAYGDYPGNPDRSLKDYLKEYWGDNVQRLRCIKRKYDPNNIFRFQQSIPPAIEECHEIKSS